MGDSCNLRGEQAVSPADFTVSIELDAGGKIVLGGDDVIFVYPTGDDESVTLDDQVLNLIRLLRAAEVEACS